MLYKVVVGAFVLFVVVGGCVRGAAMEQPPASAQVQEKPAQRRPTPTVTPYPTRTPAPSTQDTTDEPVEVDVDVDLGDDDGESWFCQRRRWC